MQMRIQGVSSVMSGMPKTPELMTNSTYFLTAPPDVGIVDPSIDGTQAAPPSVTVTSGLCSQVKY